MKKSYFGVWLSLGLALLMILFLVCGVTYKIASYLNSEVHTGTITDKYTKRDNDSDKFYIVLDNQTVIENSDLFFKAKFDSADIQARLRIGDKVEVKTIGYRIKFFSLYPVLYEVSKVGT